MILFAHVKIYAKKPNVRRGWVPQPLRRAGRPRPYDFASRFALSFYMSLVLKPVAEKQTPTVEHLQLLSYRSYALQHQGQRVAPTKNKPCRGRSCACPIPSRWNENIATVSNCVSPNHKKREIGMKPIPPNFP